MTVRVRVIERDPVEDAGHPRADALPADRVLYQGLATFLPPARDWEQVAALEGTVERSVGVRSATPLTRATHVVIEGEEYEVAGVEQRGRREWVLRCRRRP